MHSTGASVTNDAVHRDRSDLDVLDVRHDKSTMTELPFDPKQLTFIISTLDDEDLPKIRSHLLRLNQEDRYLRFFTIAKDALIERYVRDHIDLVFGRGFGIITIPDRRLIGFAHASRIENENGRVSVEVGFSVDREFRGQGLAKRLMDRVLTYCRTHHVDTMYMSCLRENRAMQAIARNAGLRIVTNADEAVAELELSPSDHAKSISQEIAYEQISVFDKAYRRNEAMMNLMLGAKS